MESHSMYSIMFGSLLIINLLRFSHNVFDIHIFRSVIVGSFIKDTENFVRNCHNDFPK